ncbi:MAG: hypothetical protein WCJ30_20085, partial [Deltaproteobacteria bacterium]
GVSDWYGAEPHVPFARVRSAVGGRSERAIESAGHTACGSWSRVSARWDAVDRWGQVLASSRLTAREYYDVSGCYEVTFDADGPPPAGGVQWQPGRAVLYQRGGWQPRPSMEWTLTPAERADHTRFMEVFAPMVLVPRPTPSDEPAVAGTPVADRTLCFRFTDQGDRDNNIAPYERYFAVTGGRLLVIAERSGGQWIARYLLNQLGNARWSQGVSYRPIAVLDMNGDGRPEVVYHDSEGSGESFGDAAVSLDPGDIWTEVARSIGGSTG